MDEIKHVFKPEFINRIDEIIVFAALTREDMKQIADLVLNEIKQRAKDQLNIRLRVSDKVRAFLADKGYDVKYGARSLKRTVQVCFEDVMAQKILDGQICPGDSVSVDVKDQQLTFRVTKRAAS